MRRREKLTQAAKGLKVMRRGGGFFSRGEGTLQLWGGISRVRTDERIYVSKIFRQGKKRLEQWVLALDEGGGVMRPNCEKRTCHGTRKGVVGASLLDGRAKREVKKRGCFGKIRKGGHFMKEGEEGRGDLRQCWLSL